MDSPISAEPVSALSAIGSAILPKSVTWPRLRAMCPSYRSVMAAIAKIAQAIQRQVVSCPPSANRASRNTGTRISRSTVSAFGRFTSETGGRPLRHGSVTDAVERPGRRDQVDAVAAGDQAAHQTARAPSVAGRQPGGVDDPDVAVDLGCLVRPAAGDTRSCGGRRAVRGCGRRAVRGVHQHQHLGADPVLGALRGQLLDQRRHPFDPRPRSRRRRACPAGRRPRCRPRPSSRTPRRRPSGRRSGTPRVRRGRPRSRRGSRR